MDSLKSMGLQVAGISAIGALAYYCLSRPKSSKSSKTKKSGSKNNYNIVLFFDENSTQCYTQPDHSADKCPLTQCPVRHLRTLKRIVSKAKSSVDVCLYNLTQPDLENAIVGLIQEGKRVRCVFGGREDEKEHVRRLRSEGAFITIKDHKIPTGCTIQMSDLLMHHKFVIVDSQILITGSMNWTTNSFNCHWDHIIITVDPFLVKQFVEEFECLYSVDSASERVYNTRPVAGVPLQACFFRRQGAMCRNDANRKKKCEKEYCMYPVYKAILHRIVSASVSVDICVQQLTLEDLSLEIVCAHENGVKIRVICEEFRCRGTGSQMKFLIDSGIPVHKQTGDGSLHHKFIIVDGKTLISGSLNWTMQSFFGNYENIILATDVNVVSIFQSEFDRLWECFPPVEGISN